jgi:hypothetical protein
MANSAQSMLFTYYGYSWFMDDVLHKLTPGSKNNTRKTFRGMAEMVYNARHKPEETPHFTPKKRDENQFILAQAVERSFEKRALGQASFVILRVMSAAI